jgi:hypothetical protein
MIRLDPGNRHADDIIRQTGFQQHLVVNVGTNRRRPETCNDQTGIMGDVRNAVANLRILFQGNDHLVEACNFKKYSLQFAIVMHVLVLTPSFEGAMEALDIVNGRELIDQKIVRMLVRSARCAHLIVERNWPTIEKLATALLPKSGMPGKEITEIVSQRLQRDPISRRTIRKVLSFVKQKNQEAES